MVRICRQKLNYCVGVSIEEPAVEILAAINSAIQTFFGPSHTTTAKSLTAEEVKVWAYHEVPLTDATLGFYTPQLAAYQTVTNNILDMLDTSSTPASHRPTWATRPSPRSARCAMSCWAALAAADLKHMHLLVCFGPNVESPKAGRSVAVIPPAEAIHGCHATAASTCPRDPRRECRHGTF